MAHKKGNGDTRNGNDEAPPRFFDMLEGDTRKQKNWFSGAILETVHTSIEHKENTSGTARAVMSFGYVKYPRAHGGCLGSRRRRRT